MESLIMKKLSIVLFAIAVSIALNASAHDRSFYLTKTTHQGDTVLTACATGYHFASIYELFYYGNLVYNTELGHSNNDSGFGAPSGKAGWMRSGLEFGGSETQCGIWTASVDGYQGTRGYLSIDTSSPYDPWSVAWSSCSTAFPVWCVSDPVQSAPAEAVFCNSFEDCPTQ